MEPSSVQLALLYHFCRLRLPALAVPLDRFRQHLERGYQLHQHRRGQQGEAPSWATYLERLHSLDFFLACACLDGQGLAWKVLPTCRASRRDTLLVDALRGRAVRLFPRDPERQEEAVLEFWGYLLAGQREDALPILARYDGQAPLVPWLLQVFKNLHLSRLRNQQTTHSLSDQDDPGGSHPGLHDIPLPEAEDARWHEEFRNAAREWLSTLAERELLLVGLMWRYRLSQREVAKLVGINEGNVSRQLDAMARRYHEAIAASLRALGWTGDDLSGFIRTEMASVLLEEPRLSADRLAALLAARGRQLPAEALEAAQAGAEGG